MPTKKQVSAFQQLKDHVKRIQKDPNHDKGVVKNLLLKMKSLKDNKSSDADSLIEKLQKRNKLLQKVSGRQ